MFSTVDIKTANGGITYPQIISITNIDKTAPEVIVSYSNSALTNKNVIATITSNEKLQEVEGWTLSEDKLKLTKVYDENIAGAVTVKDLAGNEVQAQIRIKNIDKTAPNGKINYSTTLPTNKNVIATITSNEQLQEVDGWTLSESKLQLTKEYDKNIEESIVVKDLVGNEAKANIKITNIDKIAPVEKISYSTTVFTNTSVTVVITSNEQLQEVEGWTLSEDKLKLTKVYDRNIAEVITVKDLAGNEVQAQIKITNIDKTAPEVKISYSTTAFTNTGVTVVITSNKELQEVDGWTLSEDKLKLAKTYDKNTQETMTVKDVAGNETQQTIVIKNIVDLDKKTGGTTISNKINPYTGYRMVINIIIAIIIISLIMLILKYGKTKKEK